MRMLVLLALMGLSISSHSQTKRIAHRSHSGADASFHWAGSPDNFGLHPDLARKQRRSMDSVNKQAADSLRQRIISDSLKKIRRKEEKQKDRDGNGFWTGL